MAQKPLVWREDGKLLSSIIVRHLILPACTSDSLRVLDFLKETLPEDVPLSLMRQYTPMGDIARFPELQRTITAREYRRVRDYAEQLGFPLFTQEKASADRAFTPNWVFEKKVRKPVRRERRLTRKLFPGDLLQEPDQFFREFSALGGRRAL